MTGRQRNAYRRLVDRARRAQVLAERRAHAAAAAAYQRTHSLHGVDLGGLEPEVYAMPRCVYCGRPRSHRTVACHRHRDLLAVDPKYRQVAA